MARPTLGWRSYRFFDEVCKQSSKSADLCMLLDNEALARPWLSAPGRAQHQTRARRQMSKGIRCTANGFKCPGVLSSRQYAMSQECPMHELLRKVKSYFVAPYRSCQSFYQCIHLEYSIYKYTINKFTRIK